MIIVTYKTPNNNSLKILTAKMFHISQNPIEEIISYSEKMSANIGIKVFVYIIYIFNLSRNYIYSDKTSDYIPISIQIDLNSNILLK